MDNVTKVAVCSRSFSKNSVLRSELLRRFKNVKFNDKGISLSGDSLIDFLDGQDSAIVALEVINDDILSALPQLKVIGKYGVGLDKLDFCALEKHDVRVGWTPGVNALAVAELALNLALTIVRKTLISNQVAKDQKWDQVVGRQLSSLTIGILGCGYVGTAFLRLLKGFDCKILICDTLEKSQVCKEFGVEQVPFDHLVKNVDLLSIHLPKNMDTLKILDSTAINKMKPNSFLINTARGGLVDELALYNALEKGHLSGVALDVLEQEPPQFFELINHPNCIITSHIGGSSEEAIVSMGMAAINGLDNHQTASLVEIYK